MCASRLNLVWYSKLHILWKKDVNYSVITPLKKQTCPLENSAWKTSPPFFQKWSAFSGSHLFVRCVGGRNLSHFRMPDERKILEAECSGFPEDGGCTLGRVELPPFRGCFIKTRGVSSNIT